MLLDVQPIENSGVSEFDSLQGNKFYIVARGDSFFFIWLFHEMETSH